MKTNRRIFTGFICLIALLLIVTAFAGCSKSGEGNESTVSDSTSASDTADNPEESREETSAAPVYSDVFTFSKPKDGVVIHSSMQKRLLKDSYENALKYAHGNSEVSRPKAVDFVWSYDGTATGFTVVISDKEDLSDAWIYETAESKLSVYNVKIGTKYYWQVTAHTSDGDDVSPVSTFTTDSAWPRNLYIDGITNARDLGGRNTLDGGYTRQGLLYRTARLSKNESGKAEITENGIRTMLEQLRVKSEIDLRTLSEAGITESLLGSTVTYFACPITNAKDISNNKNEIRHVFQILADENNYPIFFHCSIGTDRTNLIAFLVNGLLGVDESDLYYDYVFSNLGNIEGNTRPASQIQAADHYVAAFKKFDGDTLSEKIRNYLISIGVTDEEMNSIIKIMKVEK